MSVRRPQWEQPLTFLKLLPFSALAQLQSWSCRKCVCVCVAERSCSLKQSDRLNYRNSDCDLVPSLSAVTSKDWDFWCVREVLDLFFFNHIAASAVTWSSLVKPKLNLSSNIPQNVLVHSGARRKITSQQLYECVLHKCDQKCNNTSTAVWCTLFWSPYIWHQANIWSRQ